MRRRVAHVPTRGHVDAGQWRHEKAVFGDARQQTLVVSGYHIESVEAAGSQYVVFG